MSSTRRAAEEAELNQERWCSSPEFNHALNAIAVAKRVQLVPEPALKALLWFLQWRSLRPNGLKQIADELITQYPERIGTPTMRRVGAQLGQRYSAAEVRTIRDEPGITASRFPLKGEGKIEVPSRLTHRDPNTGEYYQVCKFIEGEEDHPNSYPASDFLEKIELAQAGFVEHLKRICLDPSVLLSRSDCGATVSYNHGERRQEIGAGVWWFDDLLGALLDHRERSIEAAAVPLANTEVSALMLDNLEFCFRQKRMILIEGNPGLGKSVTTRAFAEMQAGLVRYVEVPASNDDRSLYVKIAAALGVANGASYNGQQIKLRVEDALQMSGLGVLLDESSRMWPQFVRPRGMPSRMLWLQTMRETGTAFALCGFKFSEWRRLYAEKTQWPDEQFERRLNRTVELPPVHCESDLFEIAKAILPEGDRATHLLLASIARLNPKKGASAMVEAVITARDLCEQEGLAEVSYDLLQRAIGINHPDLIPDKEAETNDAVVASPRPSRRVTPTTARIHPTGPF